MMPSSKSYDPAGYGAPTNARGGRNHGEGFPLRWAVVLFLTALCLRAGWGVNRWQQGPPFAKDSEWGPQLTLEFPDEQQYWQMAESLRRGEGLRDELGFQATRMPLYPAFLALTVGSPAASRGLEAARRHVGTELRSAFVAQWLIGSLTAVFTALAGTTLFDRRIGVTAGIAAAVDPFFIFFSSLLLTETPFLALTVALWWVTAPLARNAPADVKPLPYGRGSVQKGRGTVQIDRGSTRRGESLRRWIGIGLLGAMCVYVREAALGLIVILLTFLVFVPGFSVRRLCCAAMAMGIVIISLLPWAARNRMVTGEWVWLTTRGGISLYDGVGPQATGASELGQIKQMPAVAGLSETEWNRYFLHESKRAIADDPGRVFRLAVMKWARLWNPFPNVETYQSPVVRLLAGGWMLPVYLFTGIGVIMLPAARGRYGLRVVVFLLLPAIYLTLVHGVFVGSVRYRLGAMPQMLILASAALVMMVDAIRLSRRRSVNGGSNP